MRRPFPIAVTALVLVAVIATSLLIFKAQKQVALGIVQHPHEALRRVSEPVHSIDDEAKGTAFALKQTMQKLDGRLNFFGLGLAAPQIGYNTRIIGIKRSYGDYQIMVNPEIVERKWTALSLSTCLSLKGLHILPRDFWVKVRYRDLGGVEREEVLRFGKATLMQQEIDHLNGILVSDYLL